MLERTHIRGLHVYRIQINPGDILSCKLDEFWMTEHPERYSVACVDQHGRIVGHIAHELEHYVGMFIKFGKKKIDVRIPPTTKPTNVGELGMQIGEETFN